MGYIFSEIEFGFLVFLVVELDLCGIRWEEGLGLGKTFLVWSLEVGVCIWIWEEWGVYKMFGLVFDVVGIE